MKQGLQLKFSQNLSLTPQLQQAIRLLQLSTLELNQEIDLLMQTNPLLERGDDFEDEYGNATDNSDDEVSLNVTSNDGNLTDNTQGDIQDNNQDNEAGSDFDSEILNTEFSESHAESNQAESLEYEAKTTESDAAVTDFSAEFSDDYDEFSNGSLWDENSTPSDDDSDFKPQETLQIGLREHLLSQLKLMPLSERDQTLALLLVDSINEDGYLEDSLENIADAMPLELEIDELELQTALHHVQNLDPIGVGARNLSECLQIYAVPGAGQADGKALFTCTWCTRLY
jgi:RNA polymerase sigma-54 factor